MPDRRSYHSTFVFENKLYIYGGLDIQNGSLNNLWELNLSTLNELQSEDPEDRERCSWQSIPINGKVQPGPVAYHTSVVYKEQMFLFGGNNYNKTVLVSDPHSDTAEKIY